MAKEWRPFADGLDASGDSEQDRQLIAHLTDADSVQEAREQYDQYVGRHRKPGTVKRHWWRRRQS